MLAKRSDCMTISSAIGNGANQHADRVADTRLELFSIQSEPESVYLKLLGVWYLHLYQRLSG